MLLGNYNVFNKNPGRAIGGPTDPTIWYKGGTAMRFYVGDHVISGQTDKSSFADGYRPPYTWILAPKAGALSSHRQTQVTFSETASLAGGLPASGSTTITFTETATGGLIVSGSGSASITFDATGTILSIAAGSGSASITLSGSALIGALAGLAGTGSITLTPTATIYAIGYLAGISTSETEFSAAALASAVWDALLADHAISGSMGAAMAAAGSAGDPWSTPLPGAYGSGTAGELLGTKVLTEDDLTKIADIILRRATSNIEASSDGDALSIRSLYGMIAQGVHKTSISGTTLTVTKSDESTTLGTRTIATSPTAKPIISFDTD